MVLRITFLAQRCVSPGSSVGRSIRSLIGWKLWLKLLLVGIRDIRISQQHQSVCFPVEDRRFQIFALAGGISAVERQGGLEEQEGQLYAPRKKKKKKKRVQVLGSSSLLEFLVGFEGTWSRDSRFCFFLGCKVHETCGPGLSLLVFWRGATAKVDLVNNRHFFLVCLERLQAVNLACSNIRYLFTICEEQALLGSYQRHGLS